MCVCFDTQRVSMILGINENKYFQPCHTFRDNTRAGFESAPLSYRSKLFRAYL
jgi:hypothetical protein